MSASEPGFIDFEVDSEWKRCIYSECCSRVKGCGGAPECSRNNSSTSDRTYLAPSLDFQSQYSPSTRQGFGSTIRRDAHSISLSLCVRKHNYENYLWQFVREGKFEGTKAYANLCLWTVLLKVRMHRRVPFGCLMRGLQGRFGLMSSEESLKFCLDGFYGMPCCGDIFGNIGADAVPWMEVSHQSTADSLHLHDGDIIFVSYSNEKLESLARLRKRTLILRTSDLQKVSSTIKSSTNAAATEGSEESGGGAGVLKSHSALPLAGVVQPPMLHRALKLGVPRPQRPVTGSHPGQSMSIAVESAQSCHFGLSVINPSEPEFEPSPLDLPNVFTEDGSELLPGSLDKLLRLRSELGDLFQVRYPGCDSGLSLAMSPDLLTCLLDNAAKWHGSSKTAPLLLDQAKARVFKFDAALLAGAADIETGASVGVGVVDELQRFARELDNRLSARSGDPPDWAEASADYFAVDTFFAAAVACVYGVSRDHRFQPYTVDLAMRSIDECFGSAALDPAAPCEHHLTRAWNLIQSLHPTARELTVLEPCLHLRRLWDSFLQANVTWKNLVGYSICCMYDEYSAKKAAFWAINYLLSHKPIYENLLAEIEAAALKSGGGPAEFRWLTLKEIEDMQFLEAFVKEVYRHTSGQFMKFQATASLTLQSQGSTGFHCKKGSQVTVLLRALNMSPRLFKSPETFCPQRFLPASQDTSLLGLPFGAMSTRRRIGLIKLKLFLILLLTRCSLRPHYASSAQINSRLYGMDVLPSIDDVTFQYRSRAGLK